MNRICRPLQAWKAMSQETFRLYLPICSGAAYLISLAGPTQPLKDQAPQQRGACYAKATNSAPDAMLSKYVKHHEHAGKVRKAAMLHALGLRVAGVLRCPTYSVLTRPIMLKAVFTAFPEV